MPRIAAVSRGPVKLLEKHVVGQVRDFLELHGWRPVRMQQTVVPSAFRTGEPGQPDYLFLRYLGGRAGAAAALWIEFKRPSGRPGKNQPEWHARERGRGGLVWTVDSFDSFLACYEAHFSWLRE
jgi:hypothetical protein